MREDAVSFSDWNVHLVAIIVPEVFIEHALKENWITQEQYEKRYTHCLLTKQGWVAMSRNLQAKEC